MITLSGRTCTLFLAAFLIPIAASAQPPNAPCCLNAALYDGEVWFAWTPPSSGPAVTGYILEIGSTPGASDVLRRVKDESPFFFAFLGWGTYYARVRAFNASGQSPASAEHSFTVRCADRSGGARNHSWRPIGSNQVQVVWDTDRPPAESMTWRVDVYRQPGRTHVMSAQPDPPTSRAITLTLAPGTYTVAVRAVRACGGNFFSPDITIISGQSNAAADVRINEFDGFVELKNVSASPVNVGTWWLMTAAGAQKAPTVAGTLPVNTTIAPGCTFLLGPSPTVMGTPVDWAISTTGQGYALVDGVGRIIDSAAYLDPVSMNPPTPFGEGALLPPLPSGSYARRGDQDTNDNSRDFSYLPTPTPANAAACRIDTSPSPPVNLSSNVAGNTVALSWTPPTSGVPTVYRLEVGTSAGATNAGVFDFPAPTTLASFAGVPNGTFYARVRAINAFGVSNPSNEAPIVVCTGGCIPPPGAVTDLAFQVTGRSVVLTWRRAAGGPAPTGYVIEVGSAPGQSNLGQVATGTTAEFATALGVPPGTYYVRVRALNGTVPGPPSSDVIIGVQ